MTAYALVHSPLVGPATWSGVVSVLRSRGHAVVAPSLLAATKGGPPFTSAMVDVVVSALEELADPAPVVVGHSGAGPLLPAIGDALGWRVACFVFVDAALPCPGRSRLSDLHPSFRSRLEGLRRPDTTLPAWDEWWGPGAIDSLVPDRAQLDPVLAELGPIPYALFEEVLPVVADWPGAPCAYLRTSKAYAIEEAGASGMGWPVSSAGDSHLELVTHPERVADAVVGLVRRATGA